MTKTFALLAAMAASAISFNAQAFDAEAKYNQACVFCHAQGVAGAPKSFDAAAWAPRMEKGMDALVASVTNGLNAMPKGGMCNDCTADNYKALITYMSTAK